MIGDRFDIVDRIWHYTGNWKNTTRYFITQTQLLGFTSGLVHACLFSMFIFYFANVPISLLMCPGFRDGFLISFPKGLAGRLAGSQTVWWPNVFQTRPADPNMFATFSCKKPLGSARCRIDARISTKKNGIYDNLRGFPRNSPTLHAFCWRIFHTFAHSLRFLSGDVFNRRFSPTVQCRSEAGCWFQIRSQLYII